jgi:DNA repair exonuclease SbcCD ATPase subunit
VADLRGALTEFEARFKGLAESTSTVKDLLAETQGWAPRLESLRNEAAAIDDEVKKLHALRRDLDAVAQTTRELGARAAQVEAMRPAVERTLADVEKLDGTHAIVRDAIEQARLAQAELTRMSAGQAETRKWLLDVEGTLSEVRGRFSDLEVVTPTLGVVEQQTQRITESIAAIEARRDSLEDLHHRLTGVTALSSSLDQKSRDLSGRMDAAEERFLHLAVQAEEAERLSHTIADVSGSVADAVRRSEVVTKSVKASEARCTSVEALAERTRALGDEIAQRQSALDAAAKDLARATAARQEAADAATEIGALASRLEETLVAAGDRADQLDVAAAELEDRAAALGRVDARLTGFEQRLAKWELTDQQVTRALEQINARQATVRTLQADLDRMVAMAETACQGVRTITSAQREVADSRELLASIQGRLEEVRELAGSLDDKERQMEKAEERLSRAEGFLADVKAGLETLQVQRALVDQAVEKVSSLRFLLKQADAMFEGLRDERKMNSDVQDALTLVEGGRSADGDEDEEDVRAA